MKRYYVMGVILSCVLLYIYSEIVSVKNLIYYEPKIYMISEDNQNFQDDLEKETEIRLFSERDKGIVFELIDSYHSVEPNKDSFYCVLTEDRVLHYYNGHILRQTYIVNPSVLDILASKKIPYENTVEFQILNSEYEEKLTYEEYKNIVNWIKKFNNKYITNNVEFFENINDSYLYRGLCLNSGCFDFRESVFECDDFCSHTKLKNGEVMSVENTSECENEYKDFICYIQSLIYDYETYNDGDSIDSIGHLVDKYYFSNEFILSNNNVEIGKRYVRVVESFGEPDYSNENGTIIGYYTNNGAVEITFEPNDIGDMRIVNIEPKYYDVE